MQHLVARRIKWLMLRIQTTYFFLFNKILYVHSFPILYVLLYVMVGVAWEGGGGGMYTAPEV